LLKVTPDPKAADRVKFFELMGVCPLSPVMDVGTGRPGSVRPFTLTPTTNIPYPTNDMAKSLIDERTNPVKTTLVLADTPKDVYYVAVLSGRSEKDFASFKESVYSVSETAAARDVVVGMNRRENGRKMYESIMVLIKKEFKYAETEEQKQKLDENQKEGGES
jgi:PHD/YefM family antitoxin component YafN of YafNO toxin-antitoxin module